MVKRKKFLRLIYGLVDAYKIHCTYAKLLYLTNEYSRNQNNDNKEKKIGNES